MNTAEGSGEIFNSPTEMHSRNRGELRWAKFRVSAVKADATYGRDLNGAPPGLLAPPRCFLSY